MKISGNWHLSEITVKTNDLFKKIEIGNLK